MHLILVECSMILSESMTSAPLTKTTSQLKKRKQNEAPLVCYLNDSALRGD
jgi:hypothetical protein